MGAYTNYWLNRISNPNAIFIVNSLFFALGSLIVFNGYNGTDDLHYALLARQLLDGQFNPFNPTDVFAGRLVLVGWQAFWFWLLGVNDWAIQIPPIITLIVCLKLLLFNSGIKLNKPSVFFLSALFYFNPATQQVVVGTMPDVYLACLTILLIYLVNKCALSKTINFKSVIGLVFIAIIGWFIKEIIGVILVLFFIVLVLMHRHFSKRVVVTYGLAMLLAGIMLAAFYLSFTGDVFFRLKQIASATYVSACRYDLFGSKYMIDRLTVKIPGIIIQHAIFPIILSWILMLVSGFKNLKHSVSFWTLNIGFLLVLFFPATLWPYAPICHENRHFYFLVPIAIWFLGNHYGSLSEISVNQSSKKMLLFAGVMLLCCLICIIYFPYAKWYLLLYALAGIVFLVLFFKKAKSTNYWITASVVAMLSMLYPVFKPIDKGFKSLKMLTEKIQNQSAVDSTSLFFIDHDTKSHVQYFTGFSNAIHFKCLDEHEFAVFKQYNGLSIQHTFYNGAQGWLLLNPLYTEHSAERHHAILAIAQKNKWRQLKVSSCSAIYLPNQEAIDSIFAIIN